MPEDYQVKPGDCMSSIAYAHGFFWQTLWNLPENAALKAKRKNQNVLMPGDIVYIPDLTVKEEPRPTDAKHKFQLKGVPEILRMKLVDARHQPRRNLDYIIEIEGIARRGKTNGSGELVESIPPDAMSGKLTFAPVAALDKLGKARPRGPKMQVLTLQLGNLHPITEVSGLKSRLTNLKFYRGPIDENLDDATKHAISKFQKKMGLPVTGEADDATKAQIQKLHGK